MSFGEAIELLKAGKRVARAGWNGKGMWLVMAPSFETTTREHKEGRSNLPFIGMVTTQGDFVPWLASQTDMLAEDWIGLAP